MKRCRSGVMVHLHDGKTKNAQGEPLSVRGKPPSIENPHPPATVTNLPTAKRFSSTRISLTDVSSQNLAGSAIYRGHFLRDHVSVSGSWLDSCDNDAPGAGVGIDCTLVPSIPAGWAADKWHGPTVT